MLVKIINFVLVALVFSTAVVARSNGNINASLVVESNDNLGNAAFEADKRDDVLTEFHLGYTGVKVLDNQWALFYAVDLGRSVNQDFDLLDSTKFDIEVGLAYKPENTFLAPTYRFAVNLGTVDAEIITRDVDYNRIALSFSKNLTDRISLQSGLERYSQRPKEERIFDSGRFFDNIFTLDRKRFFANLDYRINRRSTLYFTYSFVAGDVVSVADDSASNPRPEFAPFRDRRIHDEAFGPRGESTLYAYRLEADTNIVNLGYNFSVSRKAAIDLSYKYIDSSAENNINYEINRVSFAYLHRF